MLHEERREKFLKLVNTYIHRKGIDQMINFLDGTDFYEAPCSTKYHLNYEGGLVEHSINVCNNLFLEVAAHNLDFSDETIAIVSLFHDLCKINTYKKVPKWEKDSNNVWIQKDSYIFDEQLAYGHSEKSAMLVARFIQVLPFELQAINGHMGFSDVRGPQLIGNIFKQNKLALMLHFADMTATYITEDKR